MGQDNTSIFVRQAVDGQADGSKALSLEWSADGVDFQPVDESQVSRVAR